jgi:three-Cys-motif partner protein
MATGTTANYWDDKALPALLKHEILRSYVPKFIGMLTSTHPKVVLLDGYAGMGRYLNGDTGSAIEILEIARDIAISQNKIVDVYLNEHDPKTLAHLKAEIVDFGHHSGLNVHVTEGDVATVLEEVAKAASRFPLFIFLDPCGLGIPFALLDRILGSLRPASRLTNVPTEILLNFSAEAVRRIGGLVKQPGPNQSALSRMDDTVGGSWWRSYYAEPFGKEEAEAEVVKGYIERLARAAQMSMYSVPVRREPTHRPLYYLVFGTRSTSGSWFFGDSVARASLKWREAAESRAEGAQLSLEGIVPTPAQQQAELEEEATTVICLNLLTLLRRHGHFVVGKYPEEVFGEYLGLVREQVVRKAIKSLYKQGLISSNGQGKYIFKLAVSPPF